MIAGTLREEIAGGAYAEGQRLPTERELCSRFGASRATVRDAISKLKHDGILVSRRGAGLFIVGSGNGHAFRIPPDAADSREEQAQIFELRMVIETAGAAMAADRWNDSDIKAIEDAVQSMEAALTDREAAIQADTAFHRAIAQATGNRYFTDFARLLETSLRNNVELSYPPASQDESVLAKNYMEHIAIYRAIRARDPDRARAAMLVHLTTAAEDSGLLPAPKGRSN
ncbi:FadR/GntR family transcriptional regulator [Microbaculum sp. FT89]|uniref:FadR/GntR family transcriptional regulator n=1 Tax=Microbaculum sp. FT89 TaxID=3447298 RepID=UPI003F52E0B7